MKSLVTGANGFIGRAVCGEMIKKGWRVKGAIRERGKTGQLPEGVFPVRIGQIGSQTQWKVALEDIDTIVHLAAMVHTTDSDPLMFEEVNTKGTINLMRSAASAGVRRFVFISTVKVNGEGKESAYREIDKVQPQDAYAESKWKAEVALNNYVSQTEMEIVVLRPPLVYGPDVKANFFRLLQAVDRGIPLPFGKVNNHRSFIYIENLVDAIIQCCRHPEASGKTFFLSDDQDVSTKDLILRIAGAFGKKARLFPVPIGVISFSGRIARRQDLFDRLFSSFFVDISKFKDTLEWKPPFSMDKGLEQTVEWYLKNQQRTYDRDNQIP